MTPTWLRPIADTPRVLSSASRRLGLSSPTGRSTTGVIVGLAVVLTSFPGCRGRADLRSGSVGPDPAEAAPSKQSRPGSASALQSAPSDGSPTAAVSSFGVPTNEGRVRAQQLAHQLADSIEHEQRGAEANQAHSRPSPHPLGRFLGRFTEGDVAIAAGMAPSAGAADPDIRWRICEWRARPGSLVALSFHPAAFGARLESLVPKVMVLDTRNDHLTITADGRPKLDNASCANESGEPPGGDDRAPDFTLDPAPVRIAPHAVAVGVRFTCFPTFPAGEGSETRLLLLEPRNGKLRQVLDARIAYDTFDRPSGNETVGRASLSIDKAAHHGYFDLLLKTTIKIRGSDPVTHPLTAKQPVDRIETARLIWDGVRYRS